MARNWVLVRGIVSEEFHWWDFLPMLKNHFREHSIFTADILGNGKVSATPTPLSILENIKGLKAQVPTPGKKILFGFSLGGMLATEWAFHHPDEVQALVLINTSFNCSPFYKRFNPKALATFLLNQTEKDPHIREMKTLKVTTGLEDEQKVKELALHWWNRAQQYPPKPVNFVRQLILASKLGRYPSPPPIPVLILNSAKDRVVNPECSQVIGKRWNIPVKVHPTAGHDLTLVDPQWVIHHVESFLIENGLHQPKVETLQQNDLRLRITEEST